MVQTLSSIRARAACAVVASLFVSAPAASAPPDTEQNGAARVLRSMSDYLAAQESLSAKFDVELDIVTPDIEKIQFAASGDMMLSRPDRLRVTRKGGYSDIELIFDGKTTTVVDRYGNAYATLNGPTSVDQLIDTLRTDHFVEMPGADLLLSKSYDELMEGVVEAKHIGIGVVDGVDCEHLAFRNEDTDWQLWVRTGDRPLPCKYKITSKTVAAAPEYTIRFHDWKAGSAAKASAFTFKPAPGAKSVAFQQLANIGELPPPTPFGEGKER